MDNQDEFYMVLPSNSSMGYFDDNTTTCFTTYLQREMKLHGEWVVGLAEIYAPCTVTHVQESEAFYFFSSYDGDKLLKRDTRHFADGIYETVEQLANEINRPNDTYRHLMIVPMNTRRGYYTIKRRCDCKEDHVLEFNEKICRILGFEDPVRKGVFVSANGGPRDIEGERPATLSRAIPDQMYVYTDICEPYTVGDSQSSLLRIVSLADSNYRFGANSVHRFAPIHYLPLLYHTFHKIVIDIRDQYARSIPFEYGTLTVTLHFKRNR